MAVVWGTVQDHGGYIHVENRPGIGMSFELYFYVTREEFIQRKQPSTLQEYYGNGQQILVVDDIEDQREIARLMLEKMNYQVETAASGEEAVEFITNHKADVLVLDMIMDPGIDGLETYRRIAALHPGQKAIITSGFAETERVREAKSLGVGRYLRKPYTLENLAQAVKEELMRENQTKLTTLPVSE
jgi:CheY-like chemotaxis protein